MVARSLSDTRCNSGDPVRVASFAQGPRIARELQLQASMYAASSIDAFNTNATRSLDPGVRKDREPYPWPLGIPGSPLLGGSRSSVKRLSPESCYVQDAPGIPFRCGPVPYCPAIPS